MPRPSSWYKQWSWNLTGHCKSDPDAFPFLPHQSVKRSLSFCRKLTSESCYHIAQDEEAFWSLISAQNNSKMPLINIHLARTGTCTQLQTSTEENIGKSENDLQGLYILVWRNSVRKMQSSEVYNQSYRWYRTADFNSLTSCCSLTNFLHILWCLNRKNKQAFADRDHVGRMKQKTSCCPYTVEFLTLSLQTTIWSIQRYTEKASIWSYKSREAPWKCMHLRVQQTFLSPLCHFVCCCLSLCSWTQIVSLAATRTHTPPLSLHLCSTGYIYKLTDIPNLLNINELL